MGWTLTAKESQGSDSEAVPVQVVPKQGRRIPFSEVRAGIRGRVIAVRSATPEAIRLQEMGLSLGAEFTVLELAPFGDPVQINLRGYRLCLRRREAKGVDVEILSEGD